MAFNGSGIFNRLYNWQNDKAANIKVRADRMDNEMNGMATGLSTCITKDGQTTITADLPMAGFKHTGVGNATNRDDYAVAAQVQDGAYNYAVAGGTVDAITATTSPLVTSIPDGFPLSLRLSGTNTITTPTVSLNATTARTVTKNGGAALVVGELPIDALFRYNLSATRWELLNSPASSAAPFVDTTAIVKGSSDATKLLRFEVDGFTTATTRVLTAPNYDATIATLAGTEVFTNKKLTDSSVTFADEGDATKQLAFQCSGITTATTRTVTIPDASGTMAYAYTPLTNSLGADVNLNNTSNYFDGPSVAQGTSGTWFVSGTVTVTLTTGGDNLYAKLWDGTTVIASGFVNNQSGGAPPGISISLSGFITSPAGNLRISCRDVSNTNGKIVFNATGNSKDSTITAIRVG